MIVRLASILLIFISTLSVSFAQVNPFKDGVEQTQLTSNQINELQSYLDSVKDGLEKALVDAKGQSFESAQKIFVRAIKSAVESSDSRSPQSQLLMRIILNQALQLTVGVPGGSRSRAENGVLKLSRNQEVITIILEDSIKLALQYYQNDRDAVRNGTLVQLPYLKVAYERLVLGRLWVSSIPENQYAYYGFRLILQHWFNTVVRANNSHRVILAKEILRADRALYKTQGKSFSDVRLRYLRAVIRKLERGLYLKWNELDFNAIPEDKISGFFIRSPQADKSQTQDEDFPLVMCEYGRCFYSQDEYMQYQMDLREYNERSYGPRSMKVDLGMHSGSGVTGAIIGADLTLRTLDQSSSAETVRLGTSYGILQFRFQFRGQTDFGAEAMPRMERTFGEVGLGYILREPRRTIMVLPVFVDYVGLDDERTNVHYEGYRVSGVLSYSELFSEKKFEWTARVQPTYWIGNDPDVGEHNHEIQDQKFNNLWQFKTESEVAYHYNKELSLRLSGFYEKGKAYNGRGVKSVQDKDLSYRDVGAGASIRWSKALRYGEFYYEYVDRKSYGLTTDDQLQYHQHIFGLRGDVTP